MGREPLLKVPERNKVQKNEKSMPGKQPPVSKAVKKTAARGEWLCVIRAAEYIGVNRNWIYRRINKGTLPFGYKNISIGKTIFDSADLDDFLLSRNTPAGKKPDKGGAMR